MERIDGTTTWLQIFHLSLLTFDSTGGAESQWFYLVQKCKSQMTLAVDATLHLKTKPEVKSCLQYAYFSMLPLVLNFSSVRLNLNTWTDQTNEYTQSCLHDDCLHYFVDWIHRHNPIDKVNVFERFLWPWGLWRHLVPFELSTSRRHHDHRLYKVRSVWTRNSPVYSIKVYKCIHWAMTLNCQSSDWTDGM